MFEGRADDCYARIYQAGAKQQTNGPETTRGIGMTKSNKDIALEVLKRCVFWCELQAAQPENPGRSGGYSQDDPDPHRIDL